MDFVAEVDRPFVEGVPRFGEDSARCRTNSRRGLTDMSRSSYPPVEAACRVLDILKIVNEMRIGTINGIHELTGIPKSTVVRMLETLMAQGYVARDNMCGGYRVTHNVQSLSSGYDRVSRVIEIARPFAIDLTRRINWPIGLGVPDGDAIAIQFWTGTISPWAHTNTVLGLRPEFYHSAMGRAYMAHCSEEQRERRIQQLRDDPELNFTDQSERAFRTVLDRIRADGYAIRNPKTPPFRTLTIGMPLRDGNEVGALVSLSIYRTSIKTRELQEKVIEPLKSMICKIEAALAFMNSESVDTLQEAELGF
jgi:IclR family transcriptional regulator, mhp operon transcriptional activator